MLIKISGLTCAGDMYAKCLDCAKQEHRPGPLSDASLSWAACPACGSHRVQVAAGVGEPPRWWGVEG